VDCILRKLRPRIELIGAELRRNQNGLKVERASLTTLSAAHFQASILGMAEATLAHSTAFYYDAFSGTGQAHPTR
jgi:hypothetical protein